PVAGGALMGHAPPRFDPYAVVSSTRSRLGWTVARRPRRCLTGEAVYVVPRVTVVPVARDEIELAVAVALDLSPFAWEKRRLLPGRCGALYFDHAAPDGRGCGGPSCGDWQRSRGECRSSSRAGGEELSRDPAFVALGVAHLLPSAARRDLLPTQGDQLGTIEPDRDPLA